MKKIFIVIIFISLLIGQVPTAKAVTDWNFFGKEVIADIAARGIMRAVMTAMSDLITTTILQGDKTQSAAGRPAFVDNWRTYLGEGSFRGENIFRYQFGQASTCGYFRDSLATIFGASTENDTILPIDTKSAIARLHPYELTARCTLTTMTDIPGVRKSDPNNVIDQNSLVGDLWFNSNDAWGSFMELSRPQNNFYGAFNMATKEFKAQSDLSREVNIRETVDGFKPFKGVDKESGFFDPESPGCIRDSEGRCIGLGDTLTPANTTAGVTLKLFETEFEFISNADDIEDLMVTVIAGLLGKFTNFRAGESIEVGAVRSKVDLNDYNRTRACINVCIDRVYDGSTLECLRAVGDLLSQQLQDIEEATNSSTTIPTPPPSGGGNNTNAVIDTILLTNGNTLDPSDPAVQEAFNICSGESAEMRFAKCQMWCINFLTDDLLGEEDGRCGVNYPPPQCTCAAIDPTVTYEHYNTVLSIQQSLAQNCTPDLGITCENLGPSGLGHLTGGLNRSSATLYMNALVAAINANTNLQASYHFVGDEPILGVFNGERTEYYDVITSNGRVWNNGGKVICTPSSPVVGQ